MARQLLKCAMIRGEQQRLIDTVVQYPPGTPSPFRRIYRWRGALVAPALAAAAVTAWTTHPVPLEIVLGGGMFLVGWAGRAWAQRHLGYRVRERMRLTTCGPYGWIRNPVYVANTLAVTGTTLMAGSYWLAAGTALLCGAVYSVVVRYEEVRLARCYGRAYLAYHAVTPRWLPAGLARSAPAGCACTRSWTDVAKAEWQVPLILLPVLLPRLIR